MIDHVFSRATIAASIADQIAQILADEEENQRTLDSSLTRLRVFSERTDPWQEWQDTENPAADRSPFLNVRLIGNQFSASDGTSTTTGDVRVVVDCYAVGTAQGTTTADSNATALIREAVGFVRGVVMAAEYRYLGMDRSLVTERKIESVQYDGFDPNEPMPPVEHMRAARVMILVKGSDVSPQITPDQLDAIGLHVLSNGQVLARALWSF